MVASKNVYKKEKNVCLVIFETVLNNSFHPHLDVLQWFKCCGTAGPISVSSEKSPFIIKMYLEMTNDFSWIVFHVLKL